MHLRHQCRVRFLSCFTENGFSSQLLSCGNARASLPFQLTGDTAPIASTVILFGQICSVVFLKLIKKKKIERYRYAQLLFPVFLSLGRSFICPNIIQTCRLAIKCIACFYQAVSGCLFPILCPQAVSAVK